MKRNPLVRLIGAFVEGLDIVVLVLLLAWGVALAVVVIAGGGTGIQVGLVVLLVAFIALRLVRTSFALDKLRAPLQFVKPLSSRSHVPVEVDVEEARSPFGAWEEVAVTVQSSLEVGHGRAGLTTGF